MTAYRLALTGFDNKYAASAEELFQANIDAIEGFSKLPQAAQDIAVAEWSKELGEANRVSGLEGVVETTEFLRSISRFKSEAEAARKAVVLELLSDLKADDLAATYDSSKGTGKVDLVDAIREAAGISYKTLEGWARESVDKSLLAEISKRAKAAKGA